MKTAAAFLTALAFTAAAPAFSQERTLTERPGEPTIVSVTGQDAEVNAAIAEGRARLPYFWQHFDKPEKGESEFVLKVSFPATNAGRPYHEHIWVDHLRKTATGYEGQLADEPNWMPGKKYGDVVAFTADMIDDWGFERNGKLIGHYTTRVLVKELNPKEAAEIRAMLGENPK